jgi:hypothetical protein
VSSAACTMSKAATVQPMSTAKGDDAGGTGDEQLAAASAPFQTACRCVRFQACQTSSRHAMHAVHVRRQ